MDAPWKRYVKESRHNRTNTVWVHWCGMSIMGKFRETEDRLVVPRGYREEENRKVMIKGCISFLVGWNENIVKLDSDDSYTITVNILRLTCFKGMNGMLCEFSLNYAVSKTRLAAFHYLVLYPCAQLLTFSFKATQISYSVPFKKQNYYSIKWKASITWEK